MSRNCLIKRIKIADFIDDLKSFDKLKKYFLTKEEESRDYYIKELYDEFYVYQDPPLGVTDILYGKCCCVCMRRRGYDDPISFAGVYKVNDNGDIIGSLMGYDYIDGRLNDIEDKVKLNGIKGWGKLFLMGDIKYTNFESMKKYAQEQIKNKNKSTLQE